MTTSQGLDAGQEVDSQCLKCKDVTNHTIIAMAEGEIAKVECNVCGAKHKYRPPKAEKSTPVKKKKAVASKTPKKTVSQKKAESHFEEVMEGLDLALAKPYSMTETFKAGELMDHPTFGLGMVTSIIQPDKIEVTFNSGSKLLICKLNNPYKRVTKK